MTSYDFAHQGCQGFALLSPMHFPRIKTSVIKESATHSPVIMMKFTLLLAFSCLLGLSRADCMDKTLDDCDYGDKKPFETAKLGDEKLCQQFCSIIYESKCTFFVYDRREILCQMFDGPVEDYTSSCKITAASPQPNLEDCQAQAENDACLVRFLMFHFFLFIKNTFLGIRSRLLSI